MTEAQTPPNGGDAPAGRDVAEVKRAPIVVQDDMAILDTGRFEQMQRVASAMAAADLVPKHLQGKPANCLLIVSQAVKRRMDPLDLAQVSFVTRGRLGYEGKAIAAWVNTDPRLDGSLNYAYEGEGQNRAVTVSGKLRSEAEPRVIVGSVADWRTDNENWTKSPDQMLAYRGAREWARRHMPEVVLGVLAEDDIAGMKDGGTLREGAGGVYTPRPEAEGEAAVTETYEVITVVDGEIFAFSAPDAYADAVVADLEEAAMRSEDILREQWDGNVSKQNALDWLAKLDRRDLVAKLQDTMNALMEGMAPTADDTEPEPEAAANPSPAQAEPEADAPKQDWNRWFDDASGIIATADEETLAGIEADKTLATAPDLIKNKTADRIKTRRAEMKAAARKK